MEDTILEEDENTSPQKILKNFIKSQYVFVINSMKKKYDMIISTALRDTKAYDSYFNNFFIFFH